MSSRIWRERSSSSPFVSARPVGNGTALAHTLSNNATTCSRPTTTSTRSAALPPSAASRYSDCNSLANSRAWVSFSACRLISESRAISGGTGHMAVWFGQRRDDQGAAVEVPGGCSGSGAETGPARRPPHVRSGCHRHAPGASRPVHAWGRDPALPAVEAAAVSSPRTPAGRRRRQTPALRIQATVPGPQDIRRAVPGHQITAPAAPDPRDRARSARNPPNRSGPPNDAHRTMPPPFAAPCLVTVFPDRPLDPELPVGKGRVPPRGRLR